MTEILSLLVVFSTMFGIFYLFISTRHKQRMMLIEKGADASLFYNKRDRPKAIWKILIVNLALILMGIGVGIFLGSALHYSMGLPEEVAFPGTIFTMAGLGLFIGFKISNKIE